MAHMLFPAYVYARAIGLLFFVGLFYLLKKYYFSNPKKPNKIALITIGLFFVLISIPILIMSLFFFQYTEANVILRIVLGLVFLILFLILMIFGITSLLSTRKQKPSHKHFEGAPN